MTLVAQRAVIPTDLQNDASGGLLTASVRNDSLAIVQELTLVAVFDVVVKTVSGDRNETKTLRFDFSTQTTAKKVPGDVIDMAFGLEGLKAYSAATLRSAIVDSAYFNGGGTCKGGKISLTTACTIPVNKEFVAKNLADIVCALDIKLDKSHRATINDSLNARLQGEVAGQPPLCPEGEARALALTGKGALLSQALKKALPRCPGIVGSVISAPLVWEFWPCADCMEACTGTTSQKAIDGDLMPADVGGYGRCIAACSAKCDAGTVAQVRSMNDSDRLYNWPPQDTSAITPVTKLVGIDLAEPASHSLSSFAATPANFYPRCNEVGIKCFDLKWTGQGSGPKAERVRAAIKDDKLVLLAFDLGYGDQSQPEYWRSVLEKQFGSPIARYYSVDSRTQNTAFGASGNPRNYILARWKAEGGSVEANLLDFAPGYGEARDTELLFVAK
jgi:hypothetical protein